MSTKMGELKKALSLGCSIAAVLFVQGCTNGVRPTRLTPAPVLSEGAPAAIPGRYIVVFEDRGLGLASASRNRAVRDPAAAVLSRDAQALVRRLGGEVGHVYTAALTGFSARLTPAALEALRRLPGVAFIQAEQTFTTGIPQTPAPTGLDRTSERLLPLNNTYTHHPGESGAGVNVYVLDTGTQATHTDFGTVSRVTGGAAPAGGNQLTDCNGHGTHVAGTIGGATHGIAKAVNIHPVKVFPGCSNSTATGNVLAGINFVAANAVAPAVANLSLEGPVDPSLDTAVANTIAAGVTFVIAAGNSGVDSCNVSPARVPDAITVGATNPTTDLRWIDPLGSSNIGPCLDLFAPGDDITSAWPGAGNAATQILDGTSMAAPHVAGVAARYLTTHVTATPANVRSKILAAASVPGAADYNWPGIPNRGAGSPDVLLHWGSFGDDGYTDGDPHLRTVDGLNYDFQAAGEFVLLREDAGPEIQVRQAAVSTSFRPGPDSFGLSTCVSVNTAVAARVAGHRVTFQPDLSGAPSPDGLQLRVDGIVRPLTAGGFGVGSGRVSRTGADGLQVEFPDGTILVVTPGFWSSQNLWYLHVGVLNTRATEGLIGRRPPGSWLPALPDGSSSYAMPATPHDRYVALYQRFGNAWRVNNRTSLFDYRRGTSTATFTRPDWPTETGSCLAPPQPGQPAPPPPSRPAEPRVAQQACREVEDRKGRANCEFDVTATGDAGFARTHLLAERLRAATKRKGEREPRPDTVILPFSR
ncbi:MAG: S8 family serine peptidase [Allosphingosinicella sp.]